MVLKVADSSLLLSYLLCSYFFFFLFFFSLSRLFFSSLSFSSLFLASLLLLPLLPPLLLFSPPPPFRYFIPPGDDVWPKFHEEWFAASKEFLLSIGLREDLMGIDVHEGDSLAHYARACTDITFRFPFGVSELMGVAARGNFDLTQHAEGSGKSMEYYDEVTKEKYIPHVIEPSLGVDRLFLALICSAYAEDEIGGEKRNFLKFHPSVAPVKVSVLPLVKNKPELVEVAKKLHGELQKRWNVDFDTSGAVGRRYRRADEIGTPFCVTVDFETIEKDNCVTIRNRDTTEQIRVPIDDVVGILGKEIDGY